MVNTVAAAPVADVAPPPQPRPFLPLPPPLPRASRRTHVLVLVLIAVFGGLKGGYWAVATQVWNPIDEVQHFGYVQSLATGHGVPTVGRDLLSDELMASMKASTDLAYRSQPFRPDNDDPNWAGTQSQYEAIHGPTYYALMVPAYWVGRPFGLSASLYAVRLGTVVVGLLAIPFTWLLARRLFPRQPVAWLLAPALLVTVNGVSFGSVTNDALVVTLAVASLVALLRSLYDGQSARWALLAGIAVGATLVTKTTSGVLLPLVALAFLAWVASVRPGWSAAVRWLVLFGLGAAAAVVPWLLWNLWSYGSFSAAEQVDAITGSVLPEADLNWDGISAHASSARRGLWSSPLALDGEYRVFWERLVMIALVLGALAAAIRRSWRDLAAMLWCGTALVWAFVSMEVLVFVLLDGTGGPVGRHLLAALPSTCVMIAAAAVLVLGRRWGPVALAMAITWSLVLESRLASELVRRTYLTAVLEGDLAPAGAQTWSDGVVGATEVTTVVDCPVEAVGVGFAAPAPPEVTVRAPEGAQSAALVPSTATEVRLGAPVLPVYRLPTPVQGEVVVVTPPGSTLNVSATDRDPRARVAGAAGDAVLTTFCRTSDAEDVAFASTYPTLHPDVVSRSFLVGAPVALAGVSGVVAAGLGVVAVRGSLAARRRRARTA